VVQGTSATRDHVSFKRPGRPSLPAGHLYDTLLSQLTPLSPAAILK
jgi:hypothetical protein